MNMKPGFGTRHSGLANAGVGVPADSLSTVTRGRVVGAASLVAPYASPVPNPESRKFKDFA